MNIPSLKTRIRSSTSEEDVLKLLAEGKTYEFASTGATHRWKLAAQKKLNDLGKAPTVQAETKSVKIDESVESVEKPRPKRRKKK